jgi:hypothetical protein
MTAHRAGVGIFIVSIIHYNSQWSRRFSFGIRAPNAGLLCTCYTHGTGKSQTSVDDGVFCTSRSNLSSHGGSLDAFQSRSERIP